MSKKDVKIWQRALKGNGLYSGLIDGDFGPGTKRASFEAINYSYGVAVHQQDGEAALVMANYSSTRNKPITHRLERRIIAAATAVYGSACRVEVYSGGQDQKGEGSRRTGSVRHDDYGEGGRAADCYVYVKDKKISGVELARIGQYWLAKGYGSAGLEMATGGIHLDEWTTPPKGGGLFWTYKYSDRKPWGKKVLAMLVAGSKGEIPDA